MKLVSAVAFQSNSTNVFFAEYIVMAKVEGKGKKKQWVCLDLLLHRQRTSNRDLESQSYEVKVCKYTHTSVSRVDFSIGNTVEKLWT